MSDAHLHVIPRTEDDDVWLGAPRGNPDRNTLDGVAAEIAAAL